ncbi:hypothetical protein NNC19_07100 [Clostridium sp. SHJSY1]|uniref:hypothetical protein n=1 Tax=Clostridium sp. SHJSY1 TaxID=2942483 RepID=UPI002874CC7F|nr:hypothetical protein [Clostridium sp. SHJSY1]MDS0525440.1 hypothetical protein [Clostridium sp. SHJSY1]
MKINNLNVLVASIEEKVNSNTNAIYWTVGILDLSDGTNFNLTVREQDMISKLKAMFKYNVSLSLKDSQYGMRLSLENVNKELGSILEAK